MRLAVVRLLHRRVLRRRRGGGVRGSRQESSRAPGSEPWAVVFTIGGTLLESAQCGEWRGSLW
jgi:hypothetical protein